MTSLCCKRLAAVDLAKHEAQIGLIRSPMTKAGGQVGFLNSRMATSKTSTKASEKPIEQVV